MGRLACGRFGCRGALAALLAPLALLGAACGSSHPKAVSTAATTTAATTASNGTTTRPDGEGVPAGDAALVGSQPISKAQIAAMMAEFRAVNASEHKPFPKPGTAAYKQFQDDAVNYFVSGAVFEQRAAQELGITISDAAVQASIAKIRERTFHGSQAKMVAHFKKLGISMKQLATFQRLTLAENALPGVLARRSPIRVSDAEVRQFYNAHIGVYGNRPIRKVKAEIVKQVRKAKLDDRIHSWVAHAVRESCGEVRYQVGYHPENLGCDST